MIKVLGVVAITGVLLYVYWVRPVMLTLRERREQREAYEARLEKALVRAICALNKAKQPLIEAGKRDVPGVQEALDAQSEAVEQGADALHRSHDLDYSRRSESIQKAEIVLSSDDLAQYERTLADARRDALARPAAGPR